MEKNIKIFKHFCDINFCEWHFWGKELKKEENQLQCWTFDKWFLWEEDDDGREAFP